MLVLVINNGSTSSRFSLIDVDNDYELATGGSEGIGTSYSYFKYKNFMCEKKFNIEISNFDEALSLIFKFLIDEKYGVIGSIREIDAIGHRVVHGGEKYTKATLINEEVIKDITDLIKIAPLHNTNSISSICKCRELFPHIDNIAVFDTSFHMTIPKENFIYPIPKELYEKYKIRKYGFHGISYNYVLDRYSNIIGKEKDSINTVICHLGGGSSICAIKNGKSFDTTMEYTPLTGLTMVTRSGSIDPSVIPVIMDAYNISVNEAVELLNTKSGYLALANDKDMKSIVERSLANDQDAIFLRNIINNDFKKHLMSMMANLGTVDSIIMTGGIGAKNKEQREMLLSNLSFFGIDLDKKKNNQVFNFESIISSENSRIPIYVIPTNEEKEIAKQCKKVMEKGRKYE